MLQFALPEHVSAIRFPILGNLFSSQLVSDLGIETEMCFNMSFADDSADVNGC